MNMFLFYITNFHLLLIHNITVFSSKHDINKFKMLCKLNNPFYKYHLLTVNRNSYYYPSNIKIMISR